MATRFTRADIELINSALAHLEAEIEGEEPDGYRDDDQYESDHAAWLVELTQLRELRMKVHERRPACR